MKQEKLNQKLFQISNYTMKREINPKKYVSFFREIDLSAIENIRTKYYLNGKKKPNYTAFIIKAVSQAIAEHPYTNAKIFPGFPYEKIFKFPDIHTAVACEKDSPGAEFFAFMDVIKHTDKKSIDEIQLELNHLANATPENNPQLKSFLSLAKNLPVFIARQLFTLPAYLPSMWMKYRGASLIISSPCKYGVDSISTTWPHPLGISFGLVQKKPIVKNNKIEIVPSFTLTLCWDRCIMAGAPAARFFNSIATNLMDQKFLEMHAGEENISKDNSIEKITAIA